MKLFLSYSFSDAWFVQRVSFHLRKQSLDPYFYSDERHVKSWTAEVGTHLSDAHAFLLFLGGCLGGVQEQEALAAIRHKSEPRHANRDFVLLRIELPAHAPLPDSLALFNGPGPMRVPAIDEKAARDCAREISVSLLGTWIDDDLPIGYPFNYEKTIIKEYSQGPLSAERIAQGCPREWPQVPKRSGSKLNMIDASEIGLYRDWNKDEGRRRAEEPQVVVSALADLHASGPANKALTFPEAGPRKFLYYPCRPGGDLSVGVLVSGGIAPGINAVIAGIVERQMLYAERGRYSNTLSVRGYHNGLSALCRDGTHYSSLSLQAVQSHADLGGSMLGTSRASEFMAENPADVDEALEKAVRTLVSHRTEILYIIGGDGSMRAAHSLWKKSQDMGKDLSIVGIPKTMDNDILWIWQSFGFLSAVERSKAAIQQLQTEAESNPRLCVLQLFGSDSGFVVTHAVTASGQCDLFLIPEVPFTMRRVTQYVEEVLKKRYENSRLEAAHGMIVMAETAVPTDAEQYMEDPAVGLTGDEKREIRSFLGDKKRRVFGQTPDALRSGGLKLVSKVLEKSVRKMAGTYWRDFRVFTNEPRHLIRAIPPSSSDIIFGHRLGCLAVDCAMAGFTDFMISQWLTEYVMVPLRLVTLGRKRIPEDGIFYKSVRASTGQPANLTTPVRGSRRAAARAR
jgi:6-phosphofructokinase 1